MAVGRMFTVVSSPAWERTTFKLRDYGNHSFLTAFNIMEPAPSGSRIMMLVVVITFRVARLATYVCLLVLYHRFDDANIESLNKIDEAMNQDSYGSSDSSP